MLRQPSRPSRALALAVLPVALGAIAAPGIPVDAVAHAPVGAALQLASTLAPTLLPFAGQPTVEPPLRGAAGTPCVVDIYDDVMAGGFGTYTPPSRCPGPWAKVLLKLDISGPRSTSAADLRLVMDGVTLFWGAPQEHDGVPTWRLQRDVTDYAAWLREPRNVSGTYDWDDASGGLGDEPPTLTGHARLVFYPATSITPAQRVPQAVVPLESGSGEVVLPTNIVRAYLDVHAQALDFDDDASRAWYTCVPSKVATTWPALLSPFAPGDARFAVFSINRQGCRGGSFREIEVRIDGELAGVAPLLPWLPSDLNQRFADTVDLPAPSVQALDMVPYRVDLTPFAGLLDDGRAHTVTVAGVGADVPRPIATAGNLLLYLDPGRKTVTGARTYNNLTPAVPTVGNTLAASGDALGGALETRVARKGVIRGYVDTSRGRIYSEVRIGTQFRNLQRFTLDGLTYPDWRRYRQALELVSTVDRTSRRWRSTGTINVDHGHTCYPLELDWAGAGTIFETDEGDRASLDRARVTLRQARDLASWHERAGLPRYATTLRDSFSASHARNFGTGSDSDWASRRGYLFRDNAGSCYSATLGTLGGVLASSSLGAACPGGNALRWFAHADGSPDGLGWAPAIP